LVFQSRHARPDEPFLQLSAGGLVSGNFFEVLGVNPYIGRTFSLEDERPPGNSVAVLSYGYWREHFG
jgi:hypothetical protein